jgi:hypothetical protein
MAMRFSNTSITANWTDGAVTTFLNDGLPLDEITSEISPDVGTSFFSFSVLFDLLTAKDVDAVTIHLIATSGIAGNALLLAYSSDGTSWNNTGSPTIWTANGSWQTLTTTITSPSPPVNARYWRLSYQRLASAGTVSIGDCRLYRLGVEVTADAPPPCTPPATPVIVATPGLNGSIPQIVITGQ